MLRLKQEAPFRGSSSSQVQAQSLCEPQGMWSGEFWVPLVGSPLCLTSCLVVPQGLTSTQPRCAPSASHPKPLSSLTTWSNIGLTQEYLKPELPAASPGILGCQVSLARDVPTPPHTHRGTPPALPSDTELSPEY